MPGFRSFSNSFGHLTVGFVKMIPQFKELRHLRDLAGSSLAGESSRRETARRACARRIAGWARLYDVSPASLGPAGRRPSCGTSASTAVLRTPSRPARTAATEHASGHRKDSNQRLASCCDGPSELGEAWVGLHCRRGGVRVIGFQPQVGADASIGAIVAVDLMAAVATVLADQVPALHHLRRRGVREPWTGFQISHFVMTFQTCTLGESLRVHRENPVMVVEPTVLLRPFFSLRRRIGRVRRPFEVGRTPLPLMAGRAAQERQRVGAERADKQVQPRMGRKRLRASRGEC